MVLDEVVMNHFISPILLCDNLRYMQRRKIYHVLIKSKANARHFSASNAVNI